MPFGLGPWGWLLLPYLWPYIWYWWNWWFYGPYATWMYPPLPRESEKAMLESQAKMLEEQLEAIRKRLEELEKAS